MLEATSADHAVLTESELSEVRRDHQLGLRADVASAVCRKDFRYCLQASAGKRKRLQHSADRGNPQCPRALPTSRCLMPNASRTTLPLQDGYSRYLDRGSARPRHLRSVGAVGDDERRRAATRSRRSTERPSTASFAKRKAELRCAKIAYCHTLTKFPRHSFDATGVPYILRPHAEHLVHCCEVGLRTCRRRLFVIKSRPSAIRRKKRNDFLLVGEVSFFGIP